MKYPSAVLRWLIPVLLLAGVARAEPDPLFAPSNLLAWCIVPYDSLHRTPEQRMEMLERLGFSQYIWDWRQEHLKDLPAEIAAAQKHHIRLRGVWIWIDEKSDRVGQLGAANRQIIDAIKANGAVTEYWVGFHQNVFAGLPDADAVKKGAAMVAYLRDEVGPKGTICLYNHGDWFGEPENEIKIVQAAGPERLGIVYNLHHAEGQTERFASLVKQMLPYLKAVNLNGVRPGALDSEIIPLGQGTLERQLIHTLQQSGYRGPLGILGHTQNEDVEVVLRRNLDGLKQIAAGN